MIFAVTSKLVIGFDPPIAAEKVIVSEAVMVSACAPLIVPEIVCWPLLLVIYELSSKLIAPE